jgi:hypothetical protein
VSAVATTVIGEFKIICLLVLSALLLGERHWERAACCTAAAAFAGLSMGLGWDRQGCTG